MEATATMQQLADLRTEIFSVTEAKITKVMENVDEQCENNQQTYSDAIDSSMQQLRSQVMTAMQKEIEEKAGSSNTSMTELMKQCDQAQRVLLDEKMTTLTTMVDDKQVAQSLQMQSENAAIRAELQEVLSNLQGNMARHVKERETAIQQTISQMADKFAASIAAVHHIGSPPRGGAEGAPANAGYYGDKMVHVKKEPMGTLALKTFSGEVPADFKNWREAFDNAMDDVWPGIADVLEQVRKRQEIVTDEEFFDLVHAFAKKPQNCVEAEWNQYFVGRYFYRVFSHFCTLDALSPVKDLAKGRKGLEAYRMLSIEYDKFSANALASMVADIMQLQFTKCLSLQDIKKTFKQMVKRSDEYEDRALHGHEHNGHNVQCHQDVPATKGCHNDHQGNAR